MQPGMALVGVLVVALVWAWIAYANLTYGTSR
jgi:hypothetical protein